MVPIPGTKNVGNLEENLGALTVAGEVGEIREAVEGCVTSGDRYPGMMAKFCFGDTRRIWERRSKRWRGGEGGRMLLASRLFLSMHSVYTTRDLESIGRADSKFSVALTLIDIMLLELD